MELYLVRHADAAPGEPDELRALTPFGVKQARELGERLAAEGVRADAVLTSPLLRARQTGAELARPAGLEAEPDERLAPGATFDDVLAAVTGRGAVVVAVGHQPDCSLITEALTGEERPFAPATFARIELND